MKDQYIDPVCGMTVKPETAAAEYEFDGATYYFCNLGCKERFAADPNKYLRGNEPAPISITREDAGGQENFDTHVDPVCGMTVKAEKAAGKTEHNGESYYFCSKGCLNKFESEPQKYLEPNTAAESISRDAEYTCPMHPEIRQIGPGSCPKCGMALEPVEITLDDKEDPEFTDMKRRFWISAILTFPVFILAMGEMFPGFRAVVSPEISIWVQFVLATPVVLWGGWPFFVRAWQSIKNVSPNMFTLIALGTSAAFLLSIAALFFPEVFPASMRDPHTGLVPGYFESAAVITTLVLLGQVLELRARSQTSSAIKELLRLAPETAILIKDDGIGRNSRSAPC